MSQLAQDTFTRADQSGFGTASDSQTWNVVLGSASRFSIASNKGVITGATGTGTLAAYLGANTCADMDILVRVVLSATADSARVFLRGTANATQYRVQQESGTFLINRVVSSTVTTLATTSFTATAGTAYWIRCRVTGGVSAATLSAKIWQDGTTEPGSWTHNAIVDSSPITGAGQCGLAARHNAAGDTVKFDQFTATNLQNTHDIALRAGLLNHTNTLDIALRARLTATSTRDITLRARLAATVNTASKDIALRARLAGFRSRDVMLRACLEEAITSLPTVTPTTYTVTIGNAPYPIQEGSFALGETLVGRSTCHFSIHDPTGRLHLAHRQRVRITHSVRGRIFTGFVSTSSETNLYPNPDNLLAVACIDEHYIADKRAYEGNEWSNAYAGDIAAGLFQVLAADGVSVVSAIDHDTSTADFAQGTLSGVVAAQSLGSSSTGDGDLELAPAGQTVSIAEGAQNDFGFGTFSNTHAVGLSNRVLQLISSPALKLTGRATIPGGGNLYTYQKIYQTPGYVIQSGDTLTYGVWVSSSSPSIMAAIDIVFTDGSTMRDFNSQGIVDQLGVPAHPGSNLSGYANDQWYTRTFSLTALAGKTTAYLTVVLEGDSVGTYTAYFRHATISHGSTLQVTIFESALNVSPPQQIANSGYTNVSVSVVTAYEKSGTRISPAYSLSAAGIARQSLLSFVATLPDGMTAGVEASFDGGATYQACTNRQPIPGLLPGMGMTGRTLVLRETLTNGTPVPEQTPQLSALTVTVLPSWHAQKRDVITTTNTLSDWSAGTFSGSSQYINGHFTLNGFTRNWQDGVTSNQTLFGNSSPVAFVQSRTFGLQSGATGAVTSRLDFAGLWTNFTCEVDVLVGGTSNINTGIVYRTTGWQNNNDTYAYSAFVNTSTITLGRGTNSGSGAGTFTSIATASLTLSSGNWHRLKVIANGSNHQVFLDEVRYLNATDSTYTGAGSIGLRLYNNAGATQSTLFDNFGVALLLTAQRISPPADLSSVGLAQDSFIGWTATTPGSSLLAVEASIDGGNVWFPCTNGAAIPAIARGYNLVGLSLKTRVTLTTSDVTSQPTITALTSWVIGEMNAQGTRISPPLSLSPVGRVGNSLVDWDVLLPNDFTTLGVDVSPDGRNWTDVSTSSGNPVPFLTSRGAPYEDDFSSDQSATYTAGAIAGFSAVMGIRYVTRVFGGTLLLPSIISTPLATWNVDTPQRRLQATGGVHALFSPLGETLGDGEMLFDTDYADGGGLMWRLSADHSSCYELEVLDSLAARTPNRMRLFKVQNGQYTQLGLSTALSFTRGIPARFKVVQTGGVITVSMDYPVVQAGGSAVVGGQTQTLRYTDPSPLPAGAVALRSNGGTNRYSRLRFVAYGDDVTNQSLYTRLRLATTDPTATPQVQDLTVSVYGDTIAAGALIPATTYSTLSGTTTSIAQNLDDDARQSNYWWRILQGIPYFQPTTGMPAPFMLTGNDMLVGTKVTAVYQSDLYRNEQIVIGGTDTQATTIKRVADGVRTGFDTEDPLDSVTDILVNGQAQSFGLQGVDSGKQWYYQQGKQGITQDASGTPLADGTQVVIDCSIQIQVIAKARHEGQIALLAKLDETSGVVTMVEQAHGLTSAAAQRLAQARLAQYGVLALDLSFTTYRPGLRVGHFVPITLSQHGIVNQTFLVTEVDYSEAMATVNGVTTFLEKFKIAATTGPIVGDWSRLYA